jgi:hypothetical protein
MKTVLKVSSVLTWFNLIVWGFIATMGILAAMMAGNMYVLLIAVLMSAVVLHSYAALKLHKSVRRSNVPLSDQTPVGIRFVGFIALFLGILYVVDGIGLLQNTQDIVKLTAPQLPPEFKNVNLTKLFQGFAVFSLLAGLSISVNVFLNFRLLRWYYLVKQSDIS